MGVNEPADGGGQVVDRAEGSAADRLLGEDAEEDVHHLLEPGPHRRMLVGGVLVADHVQLDAGVGGGDFFKNLRNSWCRCLGLHASAVMRPVATSSAANLVAGPLRFSRRSRPRRP
jgi:hypothetical protein